MPSVADVRKKIGKPADVKPENEKAADLPPDDAEKPADADAGEKAETISPAGAPAGDAEPKPLKVYRVELIYNPAAVVSAVDRLDAIEKYKALVGIRSTIHDFKVSELT